MWLFLARKEGDVEKNQSNSTLWQHSKSAHEGTLRTTNWKIKVVSAHISPLSRQVTEAVRISRESASNILNSKNEFRANNIPELEIKYGTKVGSGGQKRKRILPVVTKEDETVAGKELEPVGPMVQKIEATNTNAGGDNNIATEAADHGPPTAPESPGEASSLQPEPNSVTTEANISSITTCPNDETDSPMPDRKKRRLISRVPTRNLQAKSVKELKDECKYWGLAVGGRKDILIARLEKNLKGQQVLPFKISVTTPVKRPRQTCADDDEDEDDDDDDFKPSQKEQKMDDDNVHDNVDEGRNIRMKMLRKNDVNGSRNDLDVPATAPPASQSKVLQEDISTVNLEGRGRAIVGSNSFNIKGNSLQNSISKTPNSKIISKMRKATASNSPPLSPNSATQCPNHLSHSPGKTTTRGAPHNGQGQ